MSLAKEKDLFKKRTYLFYLPARPALPHLPSNVPGERPGIYLKDFSAQSQGGYSG